MEQLVGRQQEAAALHEHLDLARDGHGCLVLIAGEAGMGKTTLARSVLGAAGCTVLHGPGVQGGTPAFGPIVEILREHLRSDDPSPLGRGPLAGHLAKLLPELDLAPVPGDRPTLVEAIRQAWSAIAERSFTAVLLDDLQWADDATLELLPTLARAATALPLLIVGAFRSDELPSAHTIRRVRGELRRAGLLVQITVGALDLASTTALLDAALGPVSAAVGRTVFDRTGGIPFFVTELGAALAAAGRLVLGPSGLEMAAGPEVPLPDSVREAVLLRASGMHDDARTAITAAAVVGMTFDPDLVTTITQLPEWPDETVRLGLVQETGPGLMGFRHALIREAFYGEIPWTRRVWLHRAVAQALTPSRGAAELIADHWLRGRQPDQARARLLEAAAGYCAVHAYRDAARTSRLALELWPVDEPVDDASRDALIGAGAEPARLAVLEQLAGCVELGGDLAEAVTTWREVVDGRRKAGDGPALGHALRRLASVLELQGRWPEALASREDAAAAYTSAGLLADAAAERLAAAAHLRSAGSFHAALALLHTAQAQAHAAGRLDLEIRIIGHLGNVRARMGEGEAAVDQVRSALAMALEHGLAGPAADIYQRLADAIEHTGDYATALDTYQEAFAFCSANALEPTAQLCLACLTAVLRQTGDWDRAVVLCRQVIATDGGMLHTRTVATGIYGTILALRGQTTRSRSLLLEAATLARQIELTPVEIFASWGLAIADHVEGADKAAAAHCRAVLERWRQTEDRHYAIPPLRWATTFFAETGDLQGARQCAAALTQIAGGTDQDEVMSALAHALGENALLDGSPAQAADQFLQALALLEGVEAPYDRAESQRRAAAALLLTGRREEAVVQLVAAHRIARRLEARPLTERLAGDLAALGEHADRRSGRRAAGASPGGLTRRETEVVRLVALGRTNREIARELFLSPRTVETHVSSIVLKLNCRSRADAARRATELGLVSRGG